MSNINNIISERYIEIIRRWNTKEFTKSNIKKIGKVHGVLLLISEAGSINYICPSANLRYTLSHLLRNGEVPAKKFKVYQTKDASSANELADKLEKEYEPYWNKFSDCEQLKHVKEDK